MQKVLLVSSLLAGSAFANAIPPPSRTRPQRRDPSATVNPPAHTTVNNNDGIGSGSSNYVDYSGDGTPADGWPAVDQWVSFVDMFNNNKNAMFSGCGQYNVPDDSGPEVGDIYNAIESVAGDSGLDHRVILAIIMNESSGCVRVPTTMSGNIYNPGLMQDYDGYYSCNHDQNNEYGGSGLTNPCPQETITGMVREGAVGTDNGDGITSLVNDAISQGATGAQIYYVAARWYNSGEDSVAVGGNLAGGGEDSTYVRDFANRLTGWTD